jgi:hypothetical protein
LLADKILLEVRKQSADFSSVTARIGDPYRGWNHGISSAAWPVLRLFNLTIKLAAHMRARLVFNH